MNIHVFATLCGLSGRSQHPRSTRGLLALLLLLGLMIFFPSTHAQTPLRDILQVAADGSHTCALTTGGGVKCWGANGAGQLGDGTSVDRWTAVEVSGLGGGVSATAAGGSHTCALTAGGGVKCWGSNYSGQLGDGSTTDRFTAVDVSGLGSGVSAIAAGRSHTCALTTAGGVKCWGDNYYVQLGDGTNVDRLTPVDVSGLGSGVSALAAGDHHTCALTAGGGVKCWGANYGGQLGNGSDTNSASAVDVSGLDSGVSAIAAGDWHTCALTSVGGVKCWGANYVGQLGDSTDTDRWTAVDVSGLSSGVSAIVAGYHHTCALTTNGGVKCWGGNSSGQLGNGITRFQLTAIDVSGLTSGVSTIAAGNVHTCAVTTLGRLMCWGNNTFGQLGDGTNAARSSAVDVVRLSSGIRALATGWQHTCALATDGVVKCWGRNLLGQLGDGTDRDRLTAVEVGGLGGGVQAIVAGYDHTCALTSNGGVKCWGFNIAGQLGDGTRVNRLAAVDVNGLASGVIALAAGLGHTCAVTMSGGVKCWGDNSRGQLGDGTTVSRLTAVDVSGLGNGVSALAAGSEHTCAITTSGGVKCWGYNNAGQLGANPTTSTLTPVDVVGLNSGVGAISAGELHTCALTTDGGVKCWGDNYHGQLGDGSGTDSWTAVDVSGLGSGVSAVTAGRRHSCALTTATGVKCWGSNRRGQIGDGSTTNRLTAADSIGLSSGVSAIAAGNEHTCAVTLNGGVKCWGDNYRGQLGIGGRNYGLPGYVLSPDLLFFDGFESEL